MPKNTNVDVTTLFAVAAILSQDKPELFAGFLKAFIQASQPQGWQQLQQRRVYTNANEHRSSSII